MRIDNMPKSINGGVSNSRVAQVLSRVSQNRRRARVVKQQIAYQEIRLRMAQASGRDFGFVAERLKQYEKTLGMLEQSLRTDEVELRIVKWEVLADRLPHNPGGGTSISPY